LGPMIWSVGFTPVNGAFLGVSILGRWGAAFLAALVRSTGYYVMEFKIGKLQPAYAPTRRRL